MKNKCSKLTFTFDKWCTSDVCEWENRWVTPYIQYRRQGSWKFELGEIFQHSFIFFRVFELYSNWRWQGRIFLRKRRKNVSRYQFPDRFMRSYPSINLFEKNRKFVSHQLLAVCSNEDAYAFAETKIMFCSLCSAKPSTPQLHADAIIPVHFERTLIIIYNEYENVP